MCSIGMNKKKKKGEESKFINKIAKWWFVLLLFIIWGYYTVKNTHYKIILEDQGLCTKAWVIGCYTQGIGINIEHIKYEFKVNNIRYIGKDIGREKTGDTVSILYLPDNPNINRRVSKNLNIDYK